MLFIIEGNVLNKGTHRVFSAGSIIGETDIIYRRVSFFSTLTLYRDVLKVTWQ